MANEQKLSDSLLEKINQLTTTANDFIVSNDDRVRQIVIDYGGKSIVYNPIAAYNKAFMDVITALVAIINNEKIDFQNAYTEQKAIEDAEEAAVSYVEPLAINNAEEIFPKQLPNEINP